VTSAAWNVAVLTPLVRTIFIDDVSFGEALDAANAISSLLSWFVAPALGFFFGGARALHTANGR
jgi:hypothetical protein